MDSADKIIQDFFDSGKCPPDLKDAIYCKVRQAKALDNAWHTFVSEEQDFKYKLLERYNK